MIDTLIIGGGSAGAIVAGILAQKSNKKIVLLEAGGSDRGPITQIPLGLTQAMHNPHFDWCMRSTSHAHLSGATAKIPRGKVLGGSGSINSMLYVRGRKSDYDEWGLPDWEGERVWQVFDELAEHVVHSEQASPHPLSHAFVKAGEALHIPQAYDFNTHQEGLGLYRVNMQRGKRWTGVDAFLRRSSAEVRTGVEVQRLELNDTRVTAALLKNGERIEARRIILCAGAINSPRLLMASGIDLPGLGENLQDHAAAALVYTSKTRGHGLAWRNAGWILSAPFSYLLRRKGAFTSPTVEAGGFVKTLPDLSVPDVQFHFGPFNLSYWGHGYFADVCVLKPKSRGRVTLEAIDLNLLSHHDDLATLERGYALLQSILTHMGQEGDQRVFPEELKSAVRHHAATAYHPVGTAALGSVLNPATFRPRGFDNLAIVDTSCMPTIPAGNTNNPTMMLAYRVAKEIL